jgi:protein-tyrosine phosphatase
VKKHALSPQVNVWFSFLFPSGELVHLATTTNNTHPHSTPYRRNQRPDGLFFLIMSESSIAETHPITESIPLKSLEEHEHEEDTGPVDAVKRADTIVDEWCELCCGC